MEINWGQVVTQGIGFLIAVWLLKRYAWEKVLQFIDKRRDAIVESFAEIDKEKSEVTAQRERYERELQNIEDTRRVRIQEAAQEAAKFASEVRENTRKEAVAMREKAKQDIAIELDKANAILKSRITEAIFTVSEMLLKERMDEKKHNRLIDEFLEQVKVE